MTSVKAKVSRSGDWWAVEVDAIPGLFTQTRTLDQVPVAVRDAASLLGVTVDCVAWSVVPGPPVSDEVLLHELKQAFNSLLSEPHVRMFRSDVRSVSADEVRALLKGRDAWRMR
jgi:hypothetical protein